jgi:glycosyltransferase involved in cell wall biosynthesis
LESYRRQEIATLGKIDIVITLTDKDKETLGKSIDKNKIVTIPTGVDTNYYTPLDNENMSYENIISFYGAMSGEANVDALLYFYSDIFPLIKKEVSDVKLIVVGANPSKEVLNLAKKNDDITVTGYVKDVRDYLRKSRVSVCSMRVGYGMRGRVLELMSMSIPVVVTKNAIDGMGLQEGHGILIRNETKDFARAVVDILCDASMRKKIGLSGRNVIMEKYSYEATYGYLSKLIKEIASGDLPEAKNS